MNHSPPLPVPAGRVLCNAANSLQAVLNANGSVRHWRSGALALNLFAASDLEAGPANLLLRCHAADGSVVVVPLLGPAAPGGSAIEAPAGRAAHSVVQGRWQQIDYRVELVLAASTSAWFWHIALYNAGHQACTLDLLYLQDVALAPWSALRLNEAYVSQYIDHQPLHDTHHGWLLAARQNQPVDGRVPWLLSGSLGRAVGFATDGLQLFGRARAAVPGGDALARPLPSQRVQHEHSLVALQDAAFTLAPGQTARRGFWGWLEADHPGASSQADLARLAAVLALPEATPPVPAGGAGDGADCGAACGAGWAAGPVGAAGVSDARSLFVSAPAWPSQQPDVAALQAWFGSTWRHAEYGDRQQVLSFFTDGPLHAVTRDKEQAVLRPHGHLLRSGRHLQPDEGAVTSTVWMAGVFHSSLTQGHASANRCLSTQRGGLGLFRALGLRAFVDRGQGWVLLDLPSAFAMTPHSATWVYQGGDHRLVLTSAAAADAPEVSLSVQVQAGAPLRLLLVHHVALQGDDGLVPADAGADQQRVHWRRLVAGVAGDQTDGVQIWPAPGSPMARRFGSGGLGLHLVGDVAGLQVQGDEALFLDGRSRGQPYLCLCLPAVQQVVLTLACSLIPPSPSPSSNSSTSSTSSSSPTARAEPVAPSAIPTLQWRAPPQAQTGSALAELADWMPWLAHNALVHYLSPRGLEQFSGGGWGTRDVCQGPVELLQALGRFDLVRGLLCRVFGAQNADGDWPQWFMFYPRDAQVRAGDSHGDIVFWPLLVLADYLAATGDAGLLDEVLPFYSAPDQPADSAPLAQHLARALAVVRERTITGTQLAAYGHGDWNDALQPADPAMRDHLCSAWTVTLHHRMLLAWVRAWSRLGRADDAGAVQAWADAVAADFQRWLVVDGVLAGFAAFDAVAEFDTPGQPSYLLHPRDANTGIHHSALAMVHAIIDGLFTPAQAAHHAALIEQHLLGPDGLRLFDRPLRYSGGPMRLFQRGESASFFGREIGLMYMHAHLRWAEALATLGRGDALLHALRLANPIGLQALVPQAALRQRNCYHSSSDAAFADRDEAWLHYDRIAQGDIALEGGWRIYSSGAGIAWRLVIQCLLGLVEQPDCLGIDPVLPPSLDGLLVQWPLYGHPVQLVYRLGPAGHGPLGITLDGQPLTLRPGHNRYRAPGVWLEADTVRARLAAGAKRMEITLG